jgi:hypothetical protein
VQSFTVPSSVDSGILVSEVSGEPGMRYCSAAHVPKSVT